MERVNKLYVVGELVDVVLRPGSNDRGAFIAGNIDVKVSDENVLTMSFFATEKTKDGRLNVRYSNYASLEQMKGSRVKVSGEIQGRAFYNKTQGQVINFNELSAGFINLATEKDANVATYEYSGFVHKPLVEKLNKEDKLYAYEIEIGQADFSGERLSLVKFQIEPNQVNIANSVRNHYLKGTTIAFNGEVVYKPITETKTEEVAFGEPLVKTFTSVQKSFLITGGKQPIMGGTAYTPEQIAKLENAYNEYIISVEKEAKSSAQSTGSTGTASPAKTSVNSLL